MYYLKLVEDSYKEAIALMPDIPLDLRTALKSHNKIPLFLHNLAKQLDQTQATRINKSKAKLADQQIKEIVYDYAKIFIQGVVAEANARQQSDVQKHLLAAQEQAKKDLDLTASGKVSGEYEDIFKEGGVIQTDERSVL